MLYELLSEIIESSKRDIWDWISISTSLITGIISLFVLGIGFYHQYLKKIRVIYEVALQSSFEGNRVSVIIQNPSILFNIVIEDIYLVMDDYFYVSLNSNPFDKKYVTGNVEAINVKPREMKRIVFSYTSAIVAGYQTSLVDFVNSSNRLSFFIVDSFGKYHKSPFIVFNKKKPKSRLSKKQFKIKKERGEFISFGYSRKQIGDVVVDESVIFEICLHNKIDGNKRYIYINEYGKLSTFLFDIISIPKEKLSNSTSFYQYLLEMQRIFGSDSEIITIAPLTKPNYQLEKFRTVREIRNEFLKDTVPSTEIYTWLLIKTLDSKYLGWSKSKGRPRNGDPENLKWIEWNKTLPYDIDSSNYFYNRGKLKKKKK